MPLDRSRHRAPPRRCRAPQGIAAALLVAPLLCLAASASAAPLRGPGPARPRVEAPGGPDGPRVTFPAGTLLPIRFLHRVVGGRDRTGTLVLVQTLAALVSDNCVVVEPFTQLLGRVTRSRGGGNFGRPGELTLAFDSLEVAPHRWQPVSAVLDSVEYGARDDVSGSGELAGGQHPGRVRLLRTGAIMGVSALAEEEEAIPVALLAGWRLVRRGPRAAILAGEVAQVRLTQPLVITRSADCLAADAHPDLVAAPDLPFFLSRTRDDRAGRHPGDPINVVLLGPRAAIDTAFARAGWVRAQEPSLRSLARGVTAAVVERSAVGAPVSTQYFEGRRQDLAFELAGPNARFRHHLRIWLLDDTTLTWVAAADQDVGLVVNPFRHTATHRVASDVDVEREVVVRELEATGCADLLQYMSPTGAALSGRNASGQPFETDGRAAVIRLKPCS
jgi:hypothetical protein